MMNERKTMVPPADIFETEDKYMLVLDMPGTTKDGIEIESEGDTLTVTGKVLEVGQEWKPVITEFELRDYKREFSIGRKVNMESIQAVYENGVLNIELGKSESAKPKKIEVQAA